MTANGKWPMEIDTGASISVASKETFETIREGMLTLELKETTVKLQTYTGEPTRVRGTTAVPVEHNGQMATLPLVITAGSSPTLLGRDWLTALQLDWRSIFILRPTLTLQQVFDEHSIIFSEGLGELRDMAAKIHVDKDAHPLFHKAQQVPFAVRKKVKEELDRLQSLGVIQPTQFSDWAAPIVPVMKSDGRVRICGDYKVTISQAANWTNTPFPVLRNCLLLWLVGRLSLSYTCRMPTYRYLSMWNLEVWWRSTHTRVFSSTNDYHLVWHQHPLFPTYNGEPTPRYQWCVCLP